MSTSLWKRNKENEAIKKKRFRLQDPNQIHRQTPPHLIQYLSSSSHSAKLVEGLFDFCLWKKNGINCKTARENLPFKKMAFSNYSLDGFSSKNTQSARN
jgi:hypothetical protein